MYFSWRSFLIGFLIGCNTSSDWCLCLSAGPVEQVRTEHPLVFKEGVEVRRLGFPPVIMPGNQRHLTI